MRFSARRMIGLIAVVAAGAAWANALWLQPGKHPAPLFAAKPPSAGATPVAHRPQPVAETSLAERMAARAEDMKELQRRLRLLGFYEGPIDGLDGPQTQMAVGFYQSAHGLEPNGMSYKDILEHVRKTTANLKPQPPRRPSS